MHKAGDYFIVTDTTLFGDTRELGYLCVLKDFDFQTEWLRFKVDTGPGSYAGDWPYCRVFLEHLVEQDFLGTPPNGSPRLNTFWIGRDSMLSHSTKTKLVRFDD